MKHGCVNGAGKNSRHYLRNGMTDEDLKLYLVRKLVGREIVYKLGYLVKKHRLLSGLTSYSAGIVTNDDSKHHAYGTFKGAEPVNEGAYDRNRGNRCRVTAWHTAVADKSPRIELSVNDRVKNGL